MANETAGNQTNMNRTLKAVLLSAGLCSLPNLCFSQVPQVVYDNSTTYRTNYYPTTFESGNQITNLAGTYRTLSQFEFSYFYNGATVTTQTWTLRLYANDGTTNSPGTALYSSDAIPLATGVNGFNTETITFPISSNLITLPDTFTWTVQFSNLGAGQNAGLLLYGP